MEKTPQKTAGMPASPPHTGTQPGADPGGDPLERFLCFAIYSTGLAFNRVYQPLLEPLGLTYPQYLAMVVLASRDGQTVSELGDQLFLESNTLTPLIKRLEAAGLLTRRRDTRDERVVRLSLTARGREVVAQAISCVPEKILKATGMSVDRLSRMQQDLVAIRANLRDLEPDAG